VAGGRIPRVASATQGVRQLRCAPPTRVRSHDAPAARGARSRAHRQSRAPRRCCGRHGHRRPRSGASGPPRPGARPGETTAPGVAARHRPSSAASATGAASAASAPSPASAALPTCHGAARPAAICRRAVPQTGAGPRLHGGPCPHRQNRRGRPPPSLRAPPVEAASATSGGARRARPGRREPRPPGSAWPRRPAERYSATACWRSTVACGRSRPDGSADVVRTERDRCEVIRTAKRSAVSALNTCGCVAASAQRPRPTTPSNRSAPTRRSPGRRSRRRDLAPSRNRPTVQRAGPFSCTRQTQSRRARRRGGRGSSS